MMTGDVDDFSFGFKAPQPAVEGSWAFYKKLKKAGLANDQISILIRKFQLDMSNRQILEEMGWTSHNHLHRRFQLALKILKRNGFGGEKK